MKEYSYLNIFRDVAGLSKYSPDDMMLRQNYGERLMKTWESIHGTRTNIFGRGPYSKPMNHSHHSGISDYLFLGLTTGAQRLQNRMPDGGLASISFGVLKLILDIPKLVVSGILFIPGAIGATIAHGIETIRLKKFLKESRKNDRNNST